MMTHQTTKWIAYPDFDCVWKQTCRIVRDTNVNVDGAVLAGPKSGRDQDHGTAWGTFKVRDEWINGNSNFVAVPEVTATNIGTDNYRFDINTANAFYHEGLYLECEAGEPGQTGYQTLHAGNQAYGINNMLTDKRYMGPILI